MLLPSVSDEIFANIAAPIALCSFLWHYPTLVLFNSTLICSVDIFLRSYQKNVYVGRGTFYPGYSQTIKQFVIFGVDLHDIVNMITWMHKHDCDNTGRYIVICQSELRENCNEEDLVSLLWSYKIVNVVLMNNIRGDKTVSGFTYYYPENCINPHPRNVENWDSVLNDPEHCQMMYPLKLKNLHRCPIIVSTFNQVPYMNLTNDPPTGADGELLVVLAAALNFSLVMMKPRIGDGWGKLEENGTWTGSLADVYNDWANFSMTSASITSSRFTTFQMSAEYAVANVAWITHPSKAEASSLKLLRPFQFYTKIAVGISFVVVVFLCIFLKSNFLLPLWAKLNVTIPNDIVLHSWALCMGLPVSSFPGNKALLCLAVSWIWYCFLIRTLYQVYLIDSLKTDAYDPEFDTIEEAIASSYGFGGGLALRDYFIENPFVFDEWQSMESVDLHPILVKLSQGLKFVLAMNVETAEIFLTTNPDKKLHILPQVIILTPTPIFFKKYSPLVKPINFVLWRLQESGIIQKIHNDNVGKKVRKEATKDNIPISMIHYTGCYAILLIGWLLSSLCFLAEILIKRKKGNTELK